MTLSTSNSDQRINHSSPDDVIRYKARRVMALKTIALGGGAILLGMLLVRAAVSLVQRSAPSPFSIERIQASAEALPAALQVAENDTSKIVYVLGSSLVEFGFSPEVFDQKLKETGVDVHSYNFGYGNADPSIHYLFAKKLVKTFANEADRIDLVVFEFAPFQATLAREKNSKKLDQVVEAVFSDGDDLLALALKKPQEAIEFFNLKYIRNGVPADAVTALFGKSIPTENRIAIKDPEQPPVSALAIQLFQHFVGMRSQKGHPGEWFVEDRGGLPVDVGSEVRELASRVTTRLQNPQRMEASRQDRLNCCDIENLEFSEALVAQFIAAIKEAQKVSKRVDVLMMPRNQDVIHLTEAGRQHLRDTVLRIKQETGVTIVDFSDSPAYPRESFFDSDHLTLFGGRLQFSRELADYYSADRLLKNQD